MSLCRVNAPSLRQVTRYASMRMSRMQLWMCILLWICCIINSSSTLTWAPSAGRASGVVVRLLPMLLPILLRVLSIVRAMVKGPGAASPHPNHFVARKGFKVQLRHRLGHRVPSLMHWNRRVACLAVLGIGLVRLCELAL